MKTQLCQYGCGQISTHTTKSSLKSGPFKGAPVHQCAKSANSCPAIKAKKVAASVAKYGTEYPWQNKEIRSKMEQTNIEKYGNACSVQGETTKAKRKATMLERYGVEQPTSNKQIAAKVSAGVTQSYINDPTLKAKQIQAKIVKYGPDYTSIVQKKLATEVANGRWVDPAKRTKWAAYKHSVKYYTAKNYKRHKDLINPTNLQTGVCQYQVDHIYSIRHGFENSVDPKLVAHPANLRMLWHVENKCKGTRSDITLEELMAKKQGPVSP